MLHLVALCSSRTGVLDVYICLLELMLHLVALCPNRNGVLDVYICLQHIVCLRQTVPECKECWISPIQLVPNYARWYYRIGILIHIRIGYDVYWLRLFLFC